MLANFAEELLQEINTLKSDGDDNIAGKVDSSNETAELPPVIIKHWLNFAVYYEKAAVVFIGQWLKDTKEDDALVNFAHQIEDEANHYRWLKKHLKRYVDSVHNFKPPKEWRFLMEDYYPNLPTLVERLAAHNVAAESGALGFAEFFYERMPAPIKETITKLIKDERFHISFGLRLLNKYCVTEEDRALARKSALESLQYMRKARSVFVNI